MVNSCIKINFFVLPISGRGKVYVPFGYGTPISIIGVLFLLYANELGTDPRCFISWDDTPKALYFYYMFGVTLTGQVFSKIDRNYPKYSKLFIPQ